VSRSERRSRSFAASDYGRAYHTLLARFGKTADEWGQLPAEVRHFHEIAFAEQQQQVADAQDDIPESNP